MNRPVFNDKWLNSLRVGVGHEITASWLDSFEGAREAVTEWCKKNGYEMSIAYAPERMELIGYPVYRLHPHTP